jgi:hypothetical protein
MAEDQPYTFINAMPDEAHRAQDPRRAHPPLGLRFRPGANYWWINDGDGRVAAKP